MTHVTDVTLAPKLNYLNYINGAEREKTIDGRPSYISGLPPTRLRVMRDRTSLTQKKVRSLNSIIRYNHYILDITDTDSLSRGWRTRS